MPTPGIIFKDVPPLFQHEFRRFFESWSNDKNVTPIRTLNVQEIPPMQLYKPGKPLPQTNITFKVWHLVSPDICEISPHTLADLDAVVTWERKMYALQPQSFVPREWADKVASSFFSKSALVP